MSFCGLRGFYKTGYWWVVCAVSCGYAQEDVSVSRSVTVNCTRGFPRRIWGECAYTPPLLLPTWEPRFLSQQDGLVTSIPGTEFCRRRQLFMSTSQGTRLRWLLP